MRWREGRRSDNVEDYRGRSFGGAGLKLGGGAILVLLLGWFFGIDPRLLFGLMQGVETTQVEPPAPGVQHTGGPDDELADFVSVVLADTEDTWTTLLAVRNVQYEAAEARALQRRGTDRLRACGYRCRPVLLSARPQGLYRPGLLSRAQGAVPGARVTSRRRM